MITEAPRGATALAGRLLNSRPSPRALASSCAWGTLAPVRGSLHTKYDLKRLPAAAGVSKEGRGVAERREVVSTKTEQMTITSLADEIAFRLQAAILAGDYPPGTHLLQDELCQRFGVSRTPVREALRKLQAKHLVLLVPNKGATVRVPGRDELIDVYSVRAELEGYACELACVNVSDELLSELSRAQDRVREAVVLYEQDGGAGPGDVSLDIQVALANSEFHGAIARAGGNECVRSIIVDLQGFFPKDYVWRAMTSADEVRALNLEEHERIRKAFARGDAVRARKEMRSHILHASAILLAYLDRLEFWQ
jgi:DNA-binding GntR family transcriptional regulator